jgi:hypothetical protein
MEYFIIMGQAIIACSINFLKSIISFVSGRQPLLQFVDDGFCRLRQLAVLTGLRAVSAVIKSSPG